MNTNGYSVYKSADQARIETNLSSALVSSDGGLRKQASIDANGILRTEIREQGLFRRIITTINVGSDKFVKGPYEMPLIWVDQEMDSAPAKCVSFGEMPEGDRIRKKMFPVVFRRIFSREITYDPVQLETHPEGAMTALRDNQMKDLMDIEDEGLFAVVAEAIGTKNTVNVDAGACQWIDVGAWSRESLALSAKGMPSGIHHLRAGTAVLNDVTYLNFHAFGREEAGGDIAQTLMVGDSVVDQVNKTKLVVTTKNHLVPDDTMFHFAPEEFLGVFFVFKDVTVWTDSRREAIVTTGCHEVIGATIGNMYAMTRSDFAGSPRNWRTGA